MWNPIRTYFERRPSSDAASAANSWPDVERPPYPRHYMLETGNVCNLRCPFCQTGRHEKGVDRGLMTPERFDAILDRIGPHAEFISMVNWGEPFMNRHLPHFASRCEALGIRTHIDSNLSVRYFDDAEAARIVSSGLSSILGSIDGATQAGYSRYRVGGSLDMALHNLRALVRARERLGRARPFLGWAFYVNRFNEHEIGAAREIAAGIGVPIWFKLLSCAPSWRSRLHETPHDPLLATPPWVADIYPDWRPPSIKGQPLSPELPGVCVLPFGFMVIDWNGDAYPCDVVFGPRFRLGNLVTQSLDEVWFGEGYVRCRSFLRNYGPRQRSRAVCEENPCPVVRKFIG